MIEYLNHQITSDTDKLKTVDVYIAYKKEDENKNFTTKVLTSVELKTEENVIPTKVTVRVSPYEREIRVFYEDHLFDSNGILKLSGQDCIDIEEILINILDTIVDKKHIPKRPVYN